MTRTRRTDIDGLDANTFLDVRSFCIIRDFVCKDLRLAEGVDEGRTASARGACKRVAKEEGKIRENTSFRDAKKDEPTTMTVN